MYQLRIKKDTSLHDLQKPLKSKVSTNLSPEEVLKEDITLKQNGAEFQRVNMPGILVFFYKPDYELYIAVICHKEYRTIAIDSNSEDLITEYLHDISDKLTEDNGFPVSDGFEFCDERIIRLIKNTKAGKINPYLPLVVVSSEGYSVNIDAGKIAERLFGLAHVILACGDESEKLIYDNFPYGVSMLTPWDGKIKLIGNPTVKNIRKTVYACNSGIIRHPATWSEIMSLWKESITSTVAESASAAENTSTEQEIETMEEELLQEAEEWKMKYTESEKSRIALQEELNSLKQSKELSQQGILSRGTEKDYYADEIKETVIKVIKNAIPNKRGRVKDILTDLVENNPVEGNIDRIKEELSSALHDDIDMNERQRNRLERLGFSISSDGKHYKVIWNNDKRYILVMSKSPSCHRTKNEQTQTFFNKILDV